MNMACAALKAITERPNFNELSNNIEQPVSMIHEGSTGATSWTTFH